MRHSTTELQLSIRNAILGVVSFFVCFAMVIALNCIISLTIFLFREAMSFSSSSSSANCFSIRVFFVQIIHNFGLNVVCLLLFRSILLSALVFTVVQPITILLYMPTLKRFMTITSATMLGLSSSVLVFPPGGLLRVHLLSGFF